MNRTIAIVLTALLLAPAASAGYGTITFQSDHTVQSTDVPSGVTETNPSDGVLVYDGPAGALVTVVTTNGSVEHRHAVILAPDLDDILAALSPSLNGIESEVESNSVDIAALLLAINGLKTNVTNTETDLSFVNATIKTHLTADSTRHTELLNKLGDLSADVEAAGNPQIDIPKQSRTLEIITLISVLLLFLVAGGGLWLARKGEW